MVKRMDKRRRLLFMGTVVALCIIAIYRCNRKRKERIMYGPMHERDKRRIDYLNYKIWYDDTKCKDMLRLEKAPFFRLCEIFRERSLLRDTINVSVEEQVAMFLNTIRHNHRTRVIAHNYGRSCEIVSRYFRLVLHAVGELRNDYIRPPSLETPSKIAGNPRFDPYFKDRIGAIDGTHIRASVKKCMEPSFRGRKSFPTQNILTAVDFDLQIIYVLAGWEGTAHDATILADALERPNGVCIPEGKFYLVDAGYGAKPGFLPPFCAVRYHLNEFRGANNTVQNEKELFNHRHSSLRITVERAIETLKRRFKVLDDAIPYFPFSVQVDVVVACCILHNYVLSQGIDDIVLPEVTWTNNPIRAARGQASDTRVMVDRRLQIANTMWQDRQLMFGN